MTSYRREDINFMFSIVLFYLDDRRGKWRPTPNCGTKRAFVCTIAFNKPVQTVTTPRRKLPVEQHFLFITWANS